MPSPSAVPTLTVTGGPHDGQTLSLPPGAQRVLGSAPDASLQLNLQNVSGRHARVVSDADGGVVISDLGSSAGTFVNGEKLEADRALAVGDRVCLGPPGAKASVKLLLVTAPAVEEPAILLDAGSNVALGGADEPAIILDDSGEAAVPPPPAPTAVAPKAAPATSPAAAKPDAEAPRKAVKGDYTDEPPSIVQAMQRQPLPVPPPPPVDLKARLGAVKRKDAVAVPRVAIAAAAAVVVMGGGYYAARSFMQGPPVMLSVLPQRVEGGQAVTIAGSSFGHDAGAVTVRVGETPGKIVSASDTQIAVQVPDIDPESGAAEFKISVETRKGRSNALPLILTAPPKIAALQPDVAMPGDEVVASGKHLKGKPLSVTVDGQEADVLEAAGDRLRFRVPAIPVVPGRAASVLARLGREQSKSINLYLGRLPLLIDVQPARARAGDRVTLRGRGFTPHPESNEVRFGAERALALSASEGEIVVTAPGAGVFGTQIEAPVYVENVNGRSNPAPFLLQRLSSGVFLPRYYAAPAPERAELVFVSTDIGPVLVLAGRGDAPSLAARAVAVAGALNALVDEALKKPVSLEARDGTLAVSGGAAIASVAPEDVAAYESLDPAAKGRRASARAIATLWAALIQEQLDLFARRQRPGRLLEVTPRGRAMMQIYSEALRRGGPGAGVPLSVVNPLPSGLLRDLREMALLLPAEGQGSAAAAMEGRWQGTMWEEGSGEKRIVVRLRLQNGRLGGSLTASAGGISGDIPIRDAGYERGVLRFAVMVGGARQQFEGKLAGEKLSGSITRAGASSALGRFSLTYVE